MKAQFSALALVAAVFTSTALAQYDNQSAPFNLVILSKNSTINGSALLACHEGAAIEGLCPSYSLHLGSAGASTYNFNTSSSDTTPSVNDTGLLTYLLVGGNFQVSEPMQLSVNPTSNVAVPLFSPSDESTQVAFDAAGKLNIQGYIDDTTSPLGLGVLKAYYRWYVCETYVGYDYQTLGWVLGDKKPQNPSCQKVEVVRVFV